jgi:Kef-type K+ transport system membrane component KefB
MPQGGGPSGDGAPGRRRLRLEVPLFPNFAANGHDVVYVLLFAVLLLVPRIVQRLRIPGAVTAFVLGAAAGPGAGLFAGDPVVGLLGTLGIVSIFLLAGLDVDLDLLRFDARRTLQHVVVRGALVALTASVLVGATEIDGRAAVVAALALLTPSGGFILDSLPALGLFADELKLIRNKVVATQVLSLGVLLIVAQSTSWERLGVSVGAVAAMVLLLPYVLQALTSVVVPHAPNSEFAFLVLLAVVCALVTRELGVYYLVGAFAVGLSARRFRDRVPAMSSDRILLAVDALASLFAPFYFFRAGTELRAAECSWESLGLGCALLVAGCGMRIASMLELSRWTSTEGPLAALRKAVPMMPTLVFTLVLADVLRARFEVPVELVGGLVAYALLNTVLPPLVLRHLPVPEYGATRRTPPAGPPS